MDQLPENPMMLLSVINTKLRDFYPGLDQLCEDLNIRREEITEKLRSVGFEYDEELNRFV